MSLYRRWDPGCTGCVLLGLILPVAIWVVFWLWVTHTI